MRSLKFLLCSLCFFSPFIHAEKSLGPRTEFFSDVPPSGIYDRSSLESLVVSHPGRLTVVTEAEETCPIDSSGLDEIVRRSIINNRIDPTIAVQNSELFLYMSVRCSQEIYNMDLEFASSTIAPSRGIIMLPISYNVYGPITPLALMGNARRAADYAVGDFKAANGVQSKFTTDQYNIDSEAWLSYVRQWRKEQNIQ